MGAELAVMEEEEAAEAKRRQECEEKKRKLAELTEAKKAEEAIAAVAEAARKAAASVKKAGKQQVEGPAEDEGASKKKMQEEDEEDMDKVAWVACCKCIFFNILYCLFTNDFRRCNNQQVKCVRPWVCGARPARSASKQSRNVMHCGARWWQKTVGFLHSV